jgi:hypothetical protein
MRYVFRLIVLGLAVLGAKFLYEAFVSRRPELRATVDKFRSRTSSAAREMGASIADAAKTVADQADEVERTAVTQAREVQTAVRDAKDEVVGDAIKPARSAV